MLIEAMAYDRASVRSLDRNGFLHVEVSNISKANVCPYYGREIPGFEALGLDPDRVYNMYRSPEEIEKATASFNNLPILCQHLPVIPDDLPHNLIVGSTGTDASFRDPFLTNSLVIWSAEYQTKIENGEQAELSCGYRWVPDMTPGETPDGVVYDGVMRDIVGNHVALVFEGRAGPDVVVGDEKMKINSRTALMVSGALASYIRPRLAKGSAAVDIGPALRSVNARSLAMDGAPRRLATAVAKLAKPSLAQDELDIDEVVRVIEAVQAADPEEDEIEEPEAPSEIAEDDEGEASKVAELLEYLKGKLSEEDYAAAAAMVATEEAADSVDVEIEEPRRKPEGHAMDAAMVKRMIADAERRGASRVAAIETAKRDVRGIVGEVFGMDSAESIYRLALETAGYDSASLTGAPISTLRAMVARETEMRKRPMAQDRAPQDVDSFNALYGSTAR